MKQSAVLVLVLLLTLCANMHAQKSFTVDFKGTLPDMPTSIYAFPSTGGVETVVIYTFNETINSCTISTTSNPSCLLREGKPGVVGSTDGSNSLLNSPISIQSNLFADMGNHKIRKYGYNQASTFAGSAKGFLDGPAASAQFNSPIGVVDYLNDVYVADAANFRIRKISDGKVSTIAGTGEMGFSGDSGPALNAKISYPYAVTANLAGVYFVDVGNFRIRKIDHFSGIISTVAGNGVRGSTGDNGLATAANIDAYTSIVALNTNYDIYFIDYTGGSIRAVLPDGKIYTVATIPKLALLSMYGESTMFAVTTDKQVYMVKSQSTCKATESYIGGKCVPVCYGASLDAACGGPLRGSCESGFSCKCQKGFSGSQCEITDKTVNSNGSKIGFCVYCVFVVVMMVGFLML